MSYTTSFHEREGQQCILGYLDALPQNQAVPSSLHERQGQQCIFGYLDALS